MKLRFNCPCCGGENFSQQDILWAGLVKEWRLSKEEERYINRQQGLQCDACGSNLRSMTLAKAIMNSYGVYTDTLKDFLKENPQIRILEINTAGHLTQFFERHKNHTLVEYPDVNIESLPFKDGKFDMVVHSDTLEHVENPANGLKETERVLKPGGYTCFTIPVVIGRLSKQRKSSSPSYHGSPGNQEYLVHTEYGSDMWTQVLEAGFEECRLTALEFPSSVAITGYKKLGTSKKSTQKFAIKSLIVREKPR